MRPKLTLGTAIIEGKGEVWQLTYMNIGSFLVGERFYRYYADAEEFCKEHNMRIIGYR